MAAPRGYYQAQPRPGFAGIANPLFAADNALMLFGDAKDIAMRLVAALKET